MMINAGFVLSKTPTNNQKYELDYINDVDILQNSIDNVFFAIQNAKYINETEVPIALIEPQNITTDIQREILIEYLSYEKKEKKLKSDNIEIKKVTKLASISNMTYIKKTALPNNIPQRKPKFTLYKPKERKNNIYLPLNGDIVMNFGDINALGVKSRGVMLQVSDMKEKNKKIISPMNGVVKFAGKFGHFRQLLILEHGENYHSLISGFDSITVKVGDKISAGDIVGNLAASQVYYELRYNGKPIDPRRKFNSL